MGKTGEMGDREKRRGFYYVYLLLCDGGSYYAGYTNNLASRLEQHQQGHGARYTRMHRPKRVIFVEEFKTRRAAMRREQQIKMLSHTQKRELARNAKKIGCRIAYA